MKRLKCEIPENLMKRATAFERLLAEKVEDYTFGWEYYEEYEEPNAGHVATFIPMEDDMTFTITISEKGADIYAFGNVNRWHIENADTYSFKDMILKTSEYNYMNLCVWEDEDYGTAINGKYTLPEWNEEIYTTEAYAKMLDGVLTHFMEEAKAFDKLFEKWN